MDFLDFSLQTDAQASFQIWLDKRSQTLFDFETRLFDSALIKISELQYIWYLNIHHIISDGWSFRLIFQNMSDLYPLALENRPNSVPPFPVYQDFIDYEQTYQNSAQYLEDETYWQQKLAKNAEPIPFYRAKMAIKQKPGVQRRAYKLGVDRTQKLKAMAKQTGF